MLARGEVKQGAVGRRVATSTSSVGATPDLTVRTEQLEELTAKPASEEVVRNDVDGGVEENEEVGGLVECVQRQVGKGSRRVVGECPDGARDEGGELTDDEDNDDPDQHHRRVDSPCYRGWRPRQWRTQAFQLVGRTRPVRV